MILHKLQSKILDSDYYNSKSQFMPRKNMSLKKRTNSNDIVLSRFNNNKFGTDIKPFGEEKTIPVLKLNDSRSIGSKQKLISIKCNLIASKNFSNMDAGHDTDQPTANVPDIDRQNCQTAIPDTNKNISFVSEADPLETESLLQLRQPQSTNMARYLNFDNLTVRYRRAKLMKPTNSKNIAARHFPKDFFNNKSGQNEAFS